MVEAQFSALRRTEGTNKSREQARPAVTTIVVGADAAERQALLALLEAGAQVDHLVEIPYAEALAACEELAPDCVLLEDSMAGAELLDQIRQRFPDPPMAVVLLTDAAEDEAPFRALSVGAQDYLRKATLSPHLLRHAVRSAVARRRCERDRQARERHVELALGANGVAAWEWDAAMQRGCWGPGARQMLGLDESTTEFRTLTEFVDPRDRELLEREIERCLRTRAEHFAHQFRVVRADGTTHRVEARARINHSGARAGVWLGVLQDAAEPRDKAVDVRSRDQMIQAIVQAAPIAIFTHDCKRQRVHFISRQGLEELGYTEQEVEALGPELISRILHPEDAHLLRQHAARLERAEVGAVVVFEHRVRTKDGAYRWMSTAATAFSRTADGHLEEVLGVSTDVTARREAEAELRASRATLSAAQKAAAVGMWDWDLLQDRARCSESYFALYGRPADTPDPTFEDWASWVHPDDRERATSEATAALAGGSYETEFRVIWPDGSVHWLSSRGRVLTESGRPVRFIGANVEITQQKVTENALRESEERFRVALQNSPVVVFNQDRELRYTWIHNPALGYRAEEVIGKRDLDIFEPDDGEVTEALKRQVLQTGAPVRQEVRIRHAGVARCYDLSIEPLRSADGSICGVTCAAADITERKLVEEALAKSEERLRIAQEAGGIGFYDWNPRTNEVFWSPRVEALFGLPTGAFESTYEAWEKRIHPEDRPGVSRMVADALLNRQERLHFDYRAVLPNGDVRWIQCLNLLFFDGEGRPLRSVGTNIDVTEQIEARQKLERMHQELQQFVSIVSHDLQAPTRAVATFSRWLEERHSGSLDKEGRKLVGFIGVSAQRMLGLLQGLLAYSKAGMKPGRERALVDCNAVVTRVLAILEADVHRFGVAVSVEPLPELWGWADQLEQLFQNLIENALKHGRGDPPLISVSVVRQQGNWVFTVADNGLGIDPTQAADVFLPFERLRARNEGSGMGLAICKRVIEQHGGRIWVEPNTGGGCRFVFTMPAASEDC